LCEKILEVETEINQEYKTMQELKKQYLAAQKRWKDLQFNRSTYLNLLREVNNERQKLHYIISVCVLEATGLPTSGISLDSVVLIWRM
jgi:molybdopterin converting factor small subunit